MKVIVAVCIYDRFENLIRWIYAWKQSHTVGAELIIIHNQDTIEDNKFKALCEVHGITYIPRLNVGFETGIIQDIFQDRLPVGEWDYLLFATDDTIPMRVDFIARYLDPFRAWSPNFQILPQRIGVSCMHISGIWTPHIRTTGFMITREVARAVKWWTDPITTKEDCYFFEHAGFQETLMAQVLNMNMGVVQGCDLKASYLWDTHHNADHERWMEWEENFKTSIL